MNANTLAEKTNIKAGIEVSNTSLLFRKSKELIQFPAADNISDHRQAGSWFKVMFIFNTIPANISLCHTSM